MTANPVETSLPYAVVLYREGRQYRLGIPALDLACEADDLAAGFQEIESAATTLLARYRGLGEEPPVELPLPQAEPPVEMPAPPPVDLPLPQAEPLVEMPPPPPVEMPLPQPEPPVEMPPPGDAAVPRVDASGGTLRSFVAVAALAALLAGTFAMVTAISTLRDIGTIARDIGRVTGGATAILDDAAGASRDFSKNLARVARTVEWVTPEREEQMRRDLRIIVEKLKPLADELRPLFTGEPPPTEPSRESQ